MDQYFGAKQIKELFLQRCLLILMFNGLLIKVGGNAKK